MNPASVRLRAIRITLMVAAGVATTMATGIAVASIPSASGVFHGCYSKKTGALRLIDPSKQQKCHAGEAAVSWNKAGLQGKPGPQGNPGPQGKQGPAGSPPAPDLSRVGMLD